MDNKRILQAVALVIAVIALVLLLPYVKKSPTPVANVIDFQSCQDAGGTIVDGEPVKCVYNGKSFEEAEHAQPDMVLDSPKYGELVKSPMTVSGKVKGGWFFEASMPAVLKDDNGKILFQGPIQADGDWMTSDYVPFQQAIPFDPGTAEFGILIISKDNPSGDPAHDASYAVPVRFK